MLALGVLLALPGVSARGQSTQSTQPADELALRQRGEQLIVYLMTMGPGDEIWEKFGHNALWVHDKAAGTDWVYNYGVFEFGGDFLIRFIEGEMLYRIQPMEAELTLREYQYFKRSIWVQKLNLPAVQKAKLQDFLEWNALPENRYYHYDYYLDNCSTRVRDALDRVLGGQIQRQTQELPAGVSFRWHNRRVFCSDFWTYTGLEFILGQPVDREISRWQEMYLPIKMMEHLRQVQVRDEQGELVPLVAEERLVYQGQAGVADAPPRFWVIGYLLVGLLVGGVFAVPARRGLRRRVDRIALGTLGVFWALLLGSAGTFLAWGCVFTRHWAVRSNENVLQFSPLALALVVLIPMALRGKAWARRAAFWVALACLASSGIGLIAKLLPGMWQSNWSMIALVLPALAGLTWALWLASGLQPTAAPELAEPAEPPEKLRSRKGKGKRK